MRRFMGDREILDIRREIEASLEGDDQANAAERQAANSSGSRTSPAQHQGDFAPLESEREGYKNAYEQIAAEIGEVRSESGGYKNAYEQLAAEIGRVRTEREGYKDAYQQIAAEIGEVRSECGGYRSAYRQIESEIGAVRSERDGYKSAYKAMSAEVGLLRLTAPRPPRTDEEAAKVVGQPSVLIATLPKSGTVYVQSVLAQTLGYVYGRSVTTPGFPKNVLQRPELFDFARGGMITVSHFQGDPLNIEGLLESGIKKGVLLVRDPRDALLSWMAFYRQRKLYRAGPAHHTVSFPTMSFEEQFEFHLTRFFRNAISWLSEWLDAFESHPELQFMIMDHEQLASNETLFFERLLSHFEIAAQVKTAERNAATHFSGNRRSDWRTGFSPEHIERLNSAVPERIWDAFGWERSCG